MPSLWLWQLRKATAGDTLLRLKKASAGEEELFFEDKTHIFAQNFKTGNEL